MLHKYPICSHMRSKAKGEGGRGGRTHLLENCLHSTYPLQAIIICSNSNSGSRSAVKTLHISTIALCSIIKQKGIYTSQIMCACVYRYVYRPVLRTFYLRTAQGENQDGGVGRHTAPPRTTRTDRESNSKGDQHQGNRK